MPKIIQLSTHVANLIAAGEVVERPASVAKELLENAVDAGASKITIEIRDGGMTFLRVTDNGCGMALEDAKTAFLRHATSKLRTAEECLFRGLLFRGFYGKSRWAAYAISAICFSFIHIGGYLGSYDPALLAMCFIQYLPAGLILAWCYEKSNTIVTPILIHTLINAIGIYSMR